MAERVVLDASAALPLLVEETTSREVKARLRAWREADTALWVPAHFWLETSNALLVRRRRAGHGVIAGLRELDELELQTAEVDRPQLLVALDLAERHGLTAYDAAYLALAEILDASLFSADRPLLRAAARRGTPVTPAGRLAESAAPYEAIGSPTWPAYREASAYLSALRARARSAPRVGS